VKAFFITGTGTGVGKTMFAGLAARFALAAGLKTAVMKPVQTGVDSVEKGDIGEIRRLAPGIVQLPDELSCPYLLGLEASPHLAAEAENVLIEMPAIKRAIGKIEAKFKPDVLLIEGAGGVCVPIGGELLTSELISFLGVPAIVVAPASLGTINHTLLTLSELRRKYVPVAGVAINRMPQEPGAVEKDNLKSIARLGKTEILAVVPEGPAQEGSGFLDCAGLKALFKA